MITRRKAILSTLFGASAVGLRAVRVATPTGVQEVECEHLISTLPLRSLVRSLSPTPPDGVRAAAEGLSYREFLVVALMLEGSDLFLRILDSLAYLMKRSAVLCSLCFAAFGRLVLLDPPQ